MVAAVQAGAEQDLPHSSGMSPAALLTLQPEHGRTGPCSSAAFCPCSWVSVLSNSKEEALNVAFSKAQGREKSSREELIQAIIEEVRGMPGNRECCDCSAPGEGLPLAMRPP